MRVIYELWGEEAKMIHRGDDSGRIKRIIGWRTIGARKDRISTILSTPMLDDRILHDRSIAAMKNPSVP